MGMENSSQENTFYDIAKNFEKFLGKADLKKLISTIHEKSENNILKGENLGNCVFLTEETLKLENETKDTSPQVKITLTGKVSEFYELFRQELGKRMDQIGSDTYRIKEWKQDIRIYENEEKKREGIFKSCNDRPIVSGGVFKIGIDE